MLSKLKRADYMYYIALIFLVFPIGNVFVGDAPSWTLILTACFLIAYLTIVISDQAWVTRLCWYVMWLYIAYFSIFSNVNYVWYVFFLINLYVYGMRPPELLNDYSISLLGLYAVIFLGVWWWRGSDYTGLLLVVAIEIFISVIGTGQWMSFKKKEHEEQLLKQHKQINLLLAENERHRIRRDLHDNLGHLFATMSVKSELAIKLLDRGHYEAARQEVRDLNSLTRQSMREVRTIVDGLNIRSLDEELARLDEMLKIAGVQLKVDNQIKGLPLTPVLESALGLCLLEAANNIVKHAQASHVLIRLCLIENQLEILVEDDGVGFEQVTKHSLHTIHERLSLAGGSVTIQSPQNPTQVCLAVPYQEG